MVNGTILPIHEERKKRPAGEAGLDELRPLREGVLHSLNQSVQPCRFAAPYCFETLKKQRVPRDPLLQHNDYTVEYLGYKAVAPF